MYTKNRKKGKIKCNTTTKNIHIIERKSYFTWENTGNKRKNNGL